MENFLEQIKALPADWQLQEEAFTSRTHRKVYPAVEPTQPELSQSGKVVVITGASQGIGSRGFATQFAKASPKAIILAARNGPQLTEVEDTIRRTNNNVEILSVPTDVADESSVESLFKRAKEQFGHVDILINNAANNPATTHTTLDKVILSEWWKIFEVNVKGTILMTSYFLRQLDTSQRGHIINISSDSAFYNQETAMAYFLSKLTITKAVENLTGQRPNITAVALHPGQVNTDMMPDYMKRFALDEPELAGAVAVWLCSGDRNWLNGRYLTVNWDVDELYAKKDDIVGQDLLKVRLTGRFGSEQFR